MTFIAATEERVPLHTAPPVNRRIHDQTEQRIAAIGDDPAAIQRRLNQVEREWDIERVLETQVSALVISGTLLGLTVDRRFFAVPLVVGAFLMQHVVQGWCPPVPVLRRLGVRTAREIEEERLRLEDRLATA